MGSFRQQTSERVRIEKPGKPREPSGSFWNSPQPVELLGTIVYEYVPLHFHRARAWTWGFDLPARRPQHVHSYTALSTSASQGREQAGTTGLTGRRTGPPALSGCSHHCCPGTGERIRGSQQLPGTTPLVPPAHSSLLHTGPFSVQQTKRLGREDWRAKGLSGTAEVL